MIFFLILADFLQILRGIIEKKLFLHRDSGSGKPARGKSGQHRAPYFLTGRCPQGQQQVPQKITAFCRDVSRNVSQRVRVKTRGKSSRGRWRHSAEVNLMGCKSKYRDKAPLGARGLLVRRLRVGRLSLRATAGLEK